MPDEPEIVVADGVAYARQRRTADAFLGLQRFAAESIEHPEELLVQLRGEIAEHGSVGLFSVHQKPGGPTVGYLVSWYRAPNAMRSVHRRDEQRALSAYQEALERVS
jgi:hypothetical protein